MINATLSGVASANAVINPFIVGYTLGTNILPIQSGQVQEIMYLLEQILILISIEEILYQ